MRTSKRVEKLFTMQGPFFQSNVEHFLSLGITEVLDHAYTLEEIIEYLETKRQSHIKDILVLFDNRKKYFFRETGEDFRINNDFFEFTLNFIGGLAKFKRHLEKATIEQISQYYKILFLEDLLRERENNYPLNPL